jgi:LemA protein
MDTLELIVLGVVGVFVLWFVLAYNSFVRLRNRAKEAWSDIDVQLKRRFDLIPNVLEAVKGYAKHESSVLESVTNARTAMMGARDGGDVKETARADNMLSGALKTLFAVSENYPDLKANANFLDLQRELADTENKIQASRRFYNGTVADLNNKIDMFPSSFIAKIFGVVKIEFFELEDKSDARDPVRVEF